MDQISYSSVQIMSYRTETLHFVHFQIQEEKNQIFESYSMQNEISIVDSIQVGIYLGTY